MQRWVSIVEGDGEVLALPNLLRRIAAWKLPNEYIEMAPPIRVKKDRFLNRPEEFSRYLLLARAKAEEGGRVLVLLDADDACPKEMGAALLQRAQAVVPDRRVSVVLANREFEAWFIASASSLSGVRGFMPRPEDVGVDAESPRNAKGWMAARMSSSYGETTDQPAFAARMDVALAHENSRSFRKLCKELVE